MVRALALCVRTAVGNALLVASGQLVMDDGAKQVFGADDVMMLPPGHDARAVGDEACVFVEFSAGTSYYVG